MFSIIYACFMNIILLHENDIHKEASSDIGTPQNMHVIKKILNYNYIYN